MQLLFCSSAKSLNEKCQNQCSDVVKHNDAASLSQNKDRMEIIQVLLLKLEAHMEVQAYKIRNKENFMKNHVENLATFINQVKSQKSKIVFSVFLEAFDFIYGKSFTQLSGFSQISGWSHKADLKQTWPKFKLFSYFQNRQRSFFRHHIFSQFGCGKISLN